MQKGVQMAEVKDNNTGTNRLEQAVLNMPDVKVYFSGDKKQEAENISAYVGSEKLGNVSLQKFSKSGEGICYYVLLDISGSISNSSFKDVISGISKLGKKLSNEDEMVLITFGEENKVVFSLTGKEIKDGKADSYLNSLSNSHQWTYLYESVSQVAEMASQSLITQYDRQVAFVITDWEDNGLGKETKEETLDAINSCGIPVYGFAVKEAKKADVNSFGEFARATGGYLTVLSGNDAADSMEAVRKELMDSYVATFEADSNKVSNSTVEVTLKFEEESKSQKVEVLQNHWIEDTEKPTVEEVTVDGIDQLRVTFSEPVEGADSAENYCLTSKKGDVSYPVYVSTGSDGTSALLSFSSEFKKGDYELAIDGIKDVSMEGNALEETVQIEIDANMLQELVGEDAAGANTGLYIGIGSAVLAVLLVVLAVLLLRRRKKKKNKSVDGGVATVPDGQDVRVHVAVEQGTLAEKEVRIHVKGQKEEIVTKIRSSMIVGRSKSCQLCFDDPTLSRQHFVLVLSSNDVMIQNLSESSFTVVNGRKLNAKPYKLNPGDEISAGQLKMTIRW